MLNALGAFLQNSDLVPELSADAIEELEAALGQLEHVVRNYLGDNYITQSRVLALIAHARRMLEHIELFGSADIREAVIDAALSTAEAANQVPDQARKIRLGEVARNALSLMFRFVSSPEGQAITGFVTKPITG